MNKKPKAEGRRGSSGHQNLIRMASKKLLNEVLGDDFLSVTFIKENPLDVKTQTDVRGGGFGSTRIATAEQRLYADIACAVVYDQKAAWEMNQRNVEEAYLKEIQKNFEAGNWEEYRRAVQQAFGMTFYIIECEINPNSNLLRDGPRLTAYQLIKQQNNNLKLILAVFEGTKVDNPEIFDAIWEFPKKESKK